MMKKAQTPILIGVIAACMSCFRLYAHQVGASDWQWVLWGARLLLQGGNPYAIPPDVLPYAKELPLYYPLPALFLAVPVAWLPSYVAGAIFVGVSSALLAYALPRWQWWMFLSPAYIISLYNAQWGPLLTAALFLPALAPLMVCKPNLGLAVFVHKPTWWGVIGGAGLLLFSVALRPSWPFEWRSALAAAQHPWPFLVMPLGPLLLLALLKWRRPDARVFLAISLIPNRLVFYDQLGLLTIAKSPRTLLVLCVLQWIGFFVSRGWDDPNNPIVVIVSCYLPTLVLLFTPNRLVRVSSHPYPARQPSTAAPQAMPAPVPPLDR